MKKIHLTEEQLNRLVKKSIKEDKQPKKKKIRLTEEQLVKFIQKTVEKVMSDKTK